jgi:cytochrome c oxidase assembly factor 1
MQPVMVLRPLQRQALPTPSKATSKLFRLAVSHLRQQSLRRSSTHTHSQTATVRPNFIPPPTESSGPLLSRLPNRALPSVQKSRTWLKTLPAFIIVITLSSLAIFNYQKSSSSTVNSILYALRTNETARSVLGDEIYFASKVPWVRGELNPMQGRIDISFWVKGRRGTGRVKFVSMRKRGNQFVSATVVTGGKIGLTDTAVANAFT